MAKKPKKRVDVSASEGVTHNPFAALAGLDAPPGDPPPTEAEAPDDPVASDAFEAKVVVRREKKGRGGKTVTRVTGITPAHRAPLAARMKRALGCGATVEGDAVVLLGSVVDRAADWLEREGARRLVRG